MTEREKQWREWYDAIMRASAKPSAVYSTPAMRSQIDLLRAQTARAGRKARELLGSIPDGWQLLNADIESLIQTAPGGETWDVRR